MPTEEVRSPETRKISAEGHAPLGDEFGGDDNTVSEQTAIGASGAGADITRPRLASYRKLLLVAAPAVACVVAAYFYLTGGRYESTENAYLQSGLVSVSPNVAGEVQEVLVQNNQRVHKGDVLFRIDPEPYALAVSEAEAALAVAITEVNGARAKYASGVSELAAARQRLVFAETEAARQQKLLADGISSQTQYDSAVLAARNARQAINTTAEENAAVAAALSGAVDAPPASQPGVRRAQATLDRARLNLSYTVVRAAQDGIVTKVDQLQVGNHVTAGHPVFSLAAMRLWVEANFKENQLRYMRVGQPAKIKLDAFPDLELSAHISSFSPGTGNRFSVLPAENATGNWVKVVQRLPVELALDRVPRDVPMQGGMSAEVTVDTGHTPHLFGGELRPRSAANGRAASH